MDKTFRATRRAFLPAATALAAFAATVSYAGEIDVANQDWSVRWDNTLKASALYRTKASDPALADSFRLLVPGVPASAFPQALNFNAGDDNFRERGFVSKRVDLLSEFDAIYRKDYGLRVSVSAWYDGAYQRSSDAQDHVNGQTPFNAFPENTKTIGGNKAELLDAFVFGGWDIGDGRRLTARFGRYALQYGESLFYGDNGIARAQGPIDISKLLSSPNAQFKEIIRPVPQISAQIQLSPGVSIGGYYQFGWEEDRLPPAGSYFSDANIPWGSSQPEFVSVPSGPIAGQYVLTPAGDVKPSDAGQFGLQMKWRLDETDLGIYAARYHDKGGQLYGDLNVVTPQNSRWYYVFPEAVKTVGISASHSIGDVNFAAETSVRWDMPLRSQNMIFPSAFSPRPQYATGQTGHANLSWLATFGPNFLSHESSLVGELAWNRVLQLNDPMGELDAGRTRDATAIQFIYSPSYRQALPGLDLSVPVGLRYTLNGTSSVVAWDAKGSGSATLGLEGNYLGVWQFAATYTHYVGEAVPFVDYRPLKSGGNPIFGQGNALADRNNIAFSLRRTF
ncbi:MAG: hypothetical protein CFE43_17920 [Burkholderiales bacterium PBB3]|nr:MAG: hypothetical protein CFE43_17920 [Burkholderiales bacterium PBB3]